MKFLKQKRTYFLLFVATLLYVIYFPPKQLLTLGRKIAADQVTAKNHTTALRIYEILKFQDDPIGINNYHALLFYAKINAGKKARKAQGNIADKAWNRTGRQGVGASFWNLAMFDLSSGRDNKRRDARATRHLQNALRLGIQDAASILAAGGGEYDRIYALMNLGDPGAAISYASEMHFSSRTDEKLAALRIAAKQGDPNAMANLGWSMKGKDDASRAEREDWLTQAADAGQGSAAGRLGDCHFNAFYFCAEVDLVKAKHWYEIAAKATLIRSNPKITIDVDYAIRLGSTPRSYSKLHGVVEHAQEQLARIKAVQDANPQN
jgi:TPR repeat protein